jgi:hypothetical protein
MAPESSTLADYGQSYEKLERLKPFPADRGALIALAAALVIPMLPVILAVVPLVVVLKASSQCRIKRTCRKLLSAAGPWLVAKRTGPCARIIVTAACCTTVTCDRRESAQGCREVPLMPEATSNVEFAHKIHEQGRH